MTRLAEILSLVIDCQPSGGVIRGCTVNSVFFIFTYKVEVSSLKLNCTTLKVKIDFALEC
jgi:hypothetical protein